MEAGQRTDVHLTDHSLLKNVYRTNVKIQDQTASLTDFFYAFFIHSRPFPSLFQPIPNLIQPLLKNIFILCVSPLKHLETIIQEEEKFGSQSV